METTKLELWCEEFWRARGYKIVSADMYLAYTRYKVSDGTCVREQLVPLLVLPDMVKEFKKEFIERWGGSSNVAGI